MKKYAKVLCTALVIVMTVSTLATLAACSDAISINWNNYLPTHTEWQEEHFYKLPTVEKLNVSDDAKATTSLYEGLVNIEDSSGVYGYVIYTGATFGKGEGYIGIRAYPFYGTVYFIASGKGTQTLYDIYGNKILSGDPVEVHHKTQAYIDGKLRNFLNVGVDRYIDEETTYYVEILEDGSLSQDIRSTLSSTTVTPDVGELFEMTGKSLHDWLDLDLDERSNFGRHDDEFLNSIYVQEYINLVIFYRDGKKISTWKKPLDIDGHITYSNGKLLYATATPIAENSRSKYNYVNRYGDKCYWQLHSYNIKTGHIRNIDTNYVISDQDKPTHLYNNTTNKFDLISSMCIPKVDGVAYAYSFKEKYIIDDSGKVAFRASAQPYGMPLMKIGKNYLTDSYNIVNTNGKLVSDLNSSLVLATTADLLVTKIDNKIGAVDFDGVVKMPFDYNAYLGYFPLQVFGSYAIVADQDDNEYFMDYSHGTVRKVTDVMGVDENHIFHGFYYPYFIGAVTDYGTDLYMPDGTLAVSNTQNAYFSILTNHVNSKVIGWLTVDINTDNDDTKREYYRVSLI